MYLSQMLAAVDSEAAHKGTNTNGCISCGPGLLARLAQARYIVIIRGCERGQGVHEQYVSSPLCRAAARGRGSCTIAHHRGHCSYRKSQQRGCGHLISTATVWQCSLRLLPCAHRVPGAARPRCQHGMAHPGAPRCGAIIIITIIMRHCLVPVMLFFAYSDYMSKRRYMCLA